MSVLTIRSNRRYAVKRIVRIKRAGRKAVEGLLIEISSEGCRISNLSGGRLELEESASLEFSDGTKWPGHVRWAHGGLAGIRLARPLHVGELSEFIQEGRAPEYEPRFGT